MLTPPGWNSVEDASIYAKIFTYAGWAALFLLGIFEILAHTYGARKDVLISAREQSLKQASDQKISSLKSELEQKGTELQQEVDSFKKDTHNAAQEAAEANRSAQAEHDALKRAEAKTAQLEEQLAQRSLSPEQREKLREILSTSPNHEVYVLNPRGDKESQAYADQFADVLDKAGWKVLPHEFWMSTVQRDFKGFHIWVAKYDNPTCAFLQKALKDATGIYADGDIAPQLTTHDHKDACVLYVGFK